MARRRVQTSRIRLPAGNIAELRIDVDRRKRIFGAGEEIVKEVMADFLNRYRDEAPRLTGRLAEGFGNVVDEKSYGNSFYKVWVENDVPYAAVVEYGTDQRAQDRTIRRIKGKLRSKATEKMREKMEAEL